MPFSGIDLSNPDPFADGAPHAFLRRLRSNFANGCKSMPVCFTPAE